MLLQRETKFPGTHSYSRIESNVRFPKHRIQRWLEERSTQIKKYCGPCAFSRERAKLSYLLDQKSIAKAPKPGNACCDNANGASTVEQSA